MTDALSQERGNEAWLAALASSDAEALDELARRVRLGLARVLRGRAGVQDHDLDDFTQEALLRIVRDRGRFRGDSRFTTWALAVATRVAFTELRRRRVRETSVDPATGLEPAADAPGREPVSGPDATLARRDLLGELERLIATALTERQRFAIRAELAGRPTVEVAERLGTSTNALYKLTHDARRKLRARLLGAGYAADDLRVAAPTGDEA